MQKCPICPRCQGIYISKDERRQQKRPLLLNCGHTFCESCCLQLAREKKTSIKCPTCFGETSLPEDTGVRGLNSDRYMLGMVIHSQKILLEQELSKLTAGSTVPTKKRGQSGCSIEGNELVKDKLCWECNKKAAVSRCVKCDCNMCQQCFKKVHSLSNTLRQHQPIPLTEYGQLEVSQMCKLHPNRPIEYYCEDDQTIICSRCVIVGTHKGHEISSLEDKNRLIMNEMEPNLQVANHVHRRLKKIDKELLSLAPDSRTEVGPALEQIKTHFQYLHGVLQVRENTLEKQVLDVYKAGLDPLEKLRGELQDEFKQLDLTIKSAQRVINNNDEIIVNAKDILDKLIHAKDIPCIVERLSTDLTQTTENISFISGPAIDTLLLEHGTVNGSLQQRYMMYTLRDKPERFTEDEESLGSASITPVDCQSVVSTATSCSEDVIIEDEQDINFESGSSRKSSNASDLVRSKSSKHKSLPSKGKLHGHNQTVFVTHIQHPRLFMVQLKSDTPKLTTLSFSMQQWSKSAGASKKHMVTGVDVDDLVLAQYSLDKQWYRARIKNVMLPEDEDDFEQINVEVVYFDYGNSEVVPITRLRNMQAKFMKHPDFAIECCLNNIVPKDKTGTWSLEAVKTFAKMVENKPMMLYIIREEGNVQHVDLCKPPDDDILDDRPMSVRDALVFLELAVLESPKSLPEPGSAQAPKRSFLSPDPRDEGETYDVVVSYAGTPHCFYAQELGEESHYLANMMAQIQDMYSKLKDSWQILCPQIGMICVAQFSGDGMWYRARIIDLSGNREVVIQYVDYGNSETVNIYKIQKILDSFLVLPAQAMNCVLIDVDPLNANEGWIDQSIRWWSECVTLKRFNMKVICLGDVSATLGNTLYVVLRDPDVTDPGDTVNTRMVEYGCGRSVGKWSEVSDVNEVAEEMRPTVPRLSYQVGGGSYPEPCEDLDQQPVFWKSRNPKPMRRYQETVLTPPQSPERPSNGGAANASRGGVGASNTSSNTTNVDIEIPEPPRFVKRSTKSPAQSPEKAASKTSPSPIKTSPSPSTISPSPRRQQGVANRLFDAAMSDVQDQPKTEVKKKSKSTTPKKSHKKDEVSHKPGRGSDKSGEVEVRVSHFIDPSEFHVQIVSAVKEGLDQLMLDMDAQYRNSEVSWVSWSKGNYLAAMSPSNGRWYRAKITKILQKNLMEVFMLDYGFCEIVNTSNLRSILRQYRKQRCFSFRCHIGGLTPAGGMKDWSRTACEFMQDQIVNKKLIIKKQGNTEDGSLPIDLIIEEYVEETALEPGRKTYHSLIEMMKEKGLAIPLPKKVKVCPDEPHVYPVLYYKKAEAMVKTGDRVMPVYVDYNAVIHCYTMEGDDIFQNMCDTLHQKLKDSDPHGNEQQWVKGQACAAFYEKDEQWHRSTVQEIEPTRIKIHFLDYGNSEWVGYDDLRADIEQFIDVPQQTFLCTLHDIRPVIEDSKWDMATLEYMHKQLVNKYGKITVIEKNGYENEYMTVNLEMNEKDFGSTLVQYGMAQRGEYITDQELQSKQIHNILKYNNPLKLIKPAAIGDMFPVLVTHVELPNVVYLQHMTVQTHDSMPEVERNRATKINKYLDQLQQLSIDINNVAPTLPSIPSPKNGLACCAQFGYDKCWYRAIIADIYPETKQLLVLFVDYGNSEIITVNKLRALPPKYQQLPCQSVRCQLADLEPPNVTLSWTSTSLMEMMTVMANKPLIARVVGHNPLCVELLEHSDNGDVENFVYQPVIDKGYIKYTPTRSRQPSVESDVTESKVAQENNESDVTDVAMDTPSDSTQVAMVTESVASNDSVSDTTPAPSTTSDIDSNIAMATGDIDSERGDSSQASSVATTTGEQTTKSWAEMAETGSMVDINELPEFEDDKEVNDKDVNTVAQSDNDTGAQSGDGGAQSGDTGAQSGDGGDSGEKKRRNKPRRQRVERVKKEKVEYVVHDDECFD